jgi:hypothetical protein
MRTLLTDADELRPVSTLWMHTPDPGAVGAETALGVGAIVIAGLTGSAEI